MPEQVEFLPRKEILAFEEITRACRIMSRLGVDKIRLTGGEPLVRKDLDQLVGELKSIEGISEIALTSNAVLLEKYAERLKQAGLDRINISLDSIDPATYREVTRRDNLKDVLQGIAAAQQAGFENIRINAVGVSLLSKTSIIQLASFCFQHNLHLRFIEFMPLDGDQNWRNDSVLNGKQILETLVAEFGVAEPVVRVDASQPASDYRFRDGTIGLINSISEPFCANCNRLRMTAEGKLHNCLFSTEEFDLRDLLRGDADDNAIQQQIIECVQAKKQGHGINSDDFVRPQRAMYQIGG